MQPPAEPRSSSLLAVQSGALSWALPSAAVVSVEAFDANATEPAVDLLERLGAATTTASGDARVLVVEVSGQRLRLLARGTLKLLEGAALSLLPLPAAVQAVSPLVSHVAVVAGKPTLFVVSPERLLHALGGEPSPSAPPFHDSARG